MKPSRWQWFRRSSSRRRPRFFRLGVELLEARNAPNDALGLSALLFAPPPLTLDLGGGDQVISPVFQKPAQLEPFVAPTEPSSVRVPAGIVTTSDDASAPVVSAERTQAGVPDIAALIGLFGGRDPDRFGEQLPCADGFAEPSDELVSLTTDAGEVVTLEAFGHSLREVHAFAAPVHSEAGLPYLGFIRSSTQPYS